MQFHTPPLHPPSSGSAPAVASAPARWLLHVDMDAFFASVEQLDAPELRGKPVIVGRGARGVVAAASYEARKYGVRSAMPLGQARRLCPQGLYVPGRYECYAALSHIVMETLGGFSPLVEKASIDEAYLDATGLERLFGPIGALCAAIKRAVYTNTGGLTCSVGAAPVKFLAKIASDMRKPDGIFLLPPVDVPAFLETLPVGKIPGVGRHFVATLQRMGITLAGQVPRYPLEFWERHHGRIGRMLFLRAQGIDPRELEGATPPKSESAEHTYATDTTDTRVLHHSLMQHAERVGARLRRHGLRGRTVTLKLKFADFSMLTRSKTLNQPTDSTQTLFDTACALLDGVPLRQRVRLIGLGASGFDVGQEQLPLFPQDATEAKRRQLDAALDKARSKYGKDTVVRGRLFAGEGGD